MIPSETVHERMQRAFRPTQRGVVGLTEQLLEACVGGHVEFERVGDRCVSRWTEGGDTQEVPAPVSAAAFRTILAHVAALCNERSPRSVSPYGGDGELVIGSSEVSVRFTNTVQEQKLEVKSHPCGSTVPQPLPVKPVKSDTVDAGCQIPEAN